MTRQAPFTVDLNHFYQSLLDAGYRPNDFAAMGDMIRSCQFGAILEDFCADLPGISGIPHDTSGVEKTALDFAPVVDAFEQLSPTAQLLVRDHMSDIRAACRSINANGRTVSSNAIQAIHKLDSFHGPDSDTSEKAGTFMAVMEVLCAAQASFSVTDKASGHEVTVSFDEKSEPGPSNDNAVARTVRRLRAVAGGLAVAVAVLFVVALLGWKTASAKLEDYERAAAKANNPIRLTISYKNGEVVRDWTGHSGKIHLNDLDITVNR